MNLRLGVGYFQKIFSSRVATGAATAFFWSMRMTHRQEAWPLSEPPSVWVVELLSWYKTADMHCFCTERWDKAYAWTHSPSHTHTHIFTQIQNSQSIPFLFPFSYPLSCVNVVLREYELFVSDFFYFCPSSSSYFASSFLFVPFIFDIKYKEVMFLLYLFSLLFCPLCVSAIVTPASWISIKHTYPTKHIHKTVGYLECL